ncbi:MAG: hypothetical protein GVY23_00495 [Spirochaetes bacterium]|jgi:anti-sigma factor RsiW|nr:hypothetical protein [Spirochaetota bacterium]
MYHNGEDISAYLDGELPDHSARELERKLEADNASSEELGRLRRLRTTLHDAEEPDFRASHNRVWMSLENRLGLKQPLWRRRVSIPYPAVAAAAVAVFALAGLLVWFVGPSSAGFDTFEGAATTAAEVQIAVGGMDGEELLGWLREQDLAGDVSMELPESARFRIMGEPQLMKAADLRGRGKSPDG